MTIIRQPIVMTHTVVTVGATTTAALAADTANTRAYVLLINDSNEAVYIKCGAEAVLNAGIRLNANGGSYEMSAAQGNLVHAAINAICTSGSKKLLVTEG